jgi:hypothetical protein
VAVRLEIDPGKKTIIDFGGCGKHRRDLEQARRILLGDGTVKVPGMQIQEEKKWGPI